MEEQLDLGPVELVVLEFPGDRADPAVVEALADVVSKGYVTLLDLVFVSRDANERVTLTDADDDLSAVGFGSLPLEARAMISEHDLDAVRDSLEPGTSAAVIVYEETWARRVATAVRAAGGEQLIHLSLDPAEVAYVLTDETKEA
jgi:uncharacterized membrane protein